MCTVFLTDKGGENIILIPSEYVTENKGEVECGLLLVQLQLRIHRER